MAVYKPIVTIDGPVGSGKTTTARKVAEKLGFAYVDTGAMYRAVTLDMLEQGIGPADETAVCGRVADTVVELRFTGGGQRTLLNGRDVSERIRELDVTRAVSAVSALGCVRERMTEMQRRLGADGGIVMEGRDIGTVVFPDAACKVFLVADPGERAKRRYRELKEKGIDIDLETLTQEIIDRDRHNTERALAPLRKAADAHEIDTTGLTFDEQVERIVCLARKAMQ